MKPIIVEGNARAKHTIFEFCGVRFYRNQEGYYRSLAGEKLHRAVWMFYNGEIPENHHIHHLNGDPADCAIKNLQCISASDHTRLHNTPEKLNKIGQAAKKQWLERPEEKEAMRQIGIAKAAELKRKNK